MIQTLARSTLIYILSFVWLVLGGATGAEPLTVRASIKPVGERKPAPAFQLEDGSGKRMRLADHRGRVVLLNFWATECGGCVKEMPWFIEFSRAYRAKGLRVIGLSMELPYSDLKNPEEGWQRVKAFVQAKRVTYPILMADETTWKGYAIGAMPATFLVDRNGQIAATYVGVVNRANMKANIQALLKEHGR